jgi:hypothetical protein
MIKRENVFGVKYLVMCPMFSIIDPATQAQLSIRSTVEFYPDAFLPEFVEVQNSIRQKLERQRMEVEAVADTLINFFNQYEPKVIKVKIEVINNNPFFPVTVIAESGLVSSVEADAKRAARNRGEENEGEGEEEQEDEKDNE